MPAVHQDLCIAMTGYYERPRSPYAGIALSVARLALVVFLIAGISHRYGIMATPGFLWVLGFVGLLLLAAIVMASLSIRLLWHKGAKGGRRSFHALFLALAVASPFLLSAVNAVRYPPLNDISTDTADPPALILSAANRPKDANPVSNPASDEIERQLAAYPQVTGRRYEAAPDRVFLAVANVVAAKGWPETGRSGDLEISGEVTIEARARTLLLGFPNDVAIRITDEGETTYVDMRSASLYGRHDFGDNAWRITDFLSALDQEMLTLAGT